MSKSSSPTQGATDLFWIAKQKTQIMNFRSTNQTEIEKEIIHIFEDTTSDLSAYSLHI